MADETTTQETTTPETHPWGDKTPEQIWADYQSSQQLAQSYRDALGGVTAEQAKQGWDWARGIAADINSGKVKYASQETTPTETKPTEVAKDEFGLPTNYEELSPREQALTIVKRLQDANKEALQQMVAAESTKANTAIQDWITRSDQEKSLLFQVLEASRMNPKLDVKAALQKAAEFKSMSPDQLLANAIAQASAPDPNAGFDEKVAAEVARRLQEENTKRLEGAFGIPSSQRKISLKSKAPSREETNRKLMKAWLDAGFKG